MDVDDLEQELWTLLAEGAPVADDKAHVAKRTVHYVYNLLKRSYTSKASVDSEPRPLGSEETDEALNREEDSYFEDEDGYLEREAGLVPVDKLRA